MIGKRIGYGREAMSPYNLTATMVGASILWIGWFGFNGGSGLAANERAVMAIVVTQIAAAAAGCAWMACEWISRGKPSLLGMLSGAVAGLVVITPASGFVEPMPALFMGLVGGAVCFWSATTLKRASGMTIPWMPSACTAWAALWEHFLPGCLQRAPSRKAPFLT